MNAPKSDMGAARAFLDWYRPGGPWVLTAISTDRKSIETRTFSEAEQPEAWIERESGQRNIYFHVNPTTRPLTKKALREDVRGLAWLHVDIDPRAGEDIALERLRARRLLNEPPQGTPRPHCVIFSGGCYQGFWRLDAEEPINGSVEKCEDLKRYNQALELAFGADNCHNVDRIMRLPGTINIPDEKKRKKGRVPELARVEWMEEGTIALNAITPTPKHAEIQGTLAASELGELPMLDSIDKLDQWSVASDIKAIIVAGTGTPTATMRDTSRSGWVFKVAGALARASVPDLTALAVLTNPDWGISASILENRDPVRYAARQLERAKVSIAEWPNLNAANKPARTYANTRAAIVKLGVDCRQDVFRDRLLLGSCPIAEEITELSDAGCSALRQAILDEFGFDPGKDHVRDAAFELCIENRFDPVLNEIAALKWDGVQRLDKWVVAYLGAADTAYNCAVGRKLLLAAVRRPRQPGCKFDTIVVLEGPQGSGKSSALQILAGDDSFFSDQEILLLDARAQQESITGKWIYEIGELAGLSRADRARVKAFASRTHDRARPAYGRRPVDAPRRCIFVGTTNEEVYLSDETGNRRFLPLKTSAIDVPALRRDRDQLLAEAAVAEQSGETLELPAELWAEAAMQQEGRRHEDPWLEHLAMVKGVLHDGEFRVATTHLLTEVLGIPIAKQTGHHHTHLKNCMNRLGWNGPGKMRINTISQRGYSRLCVQPENNLEMPF